MHKLTVAIVQLNSQGDVGRNRDKIARLLADLAPVDLIALPEVFAFRGADSRYRKMAEPLDGPVVSHLASLARQRSSWLLAGSVMEKAGKHVYNTSVLLDRSGAIAAAYRKIHLFEASLDDGRVIRECEAYEPGNQPVTADLEGWRIGMAVCYDLRFPELFRRYAAEGAHMLAIPSNFTQRTGKDHWEILVRARAIENQCYVVAPNQCGANADTGVASYGHSMAVAPWGEILCRATDREEVLVARLSPAEIEATRARIPALRHRKL